MDLQRKNDSLTTILDTLKTKFIFDRVYIRQIPSTENSDKPGSKYKGEFVFVGYNKEDVVLFGNDKDNFSNAQPISVRKGALGAYGFETILEKDTTTFAFRPMIKSPTALQFRNAGYNGITFVDRKVLK